jgi:small subunit ribosomal protein S9
MTAAKKEEKKEVKKKAAAPAKKPAVKAKKEVKKEAKPKEAKPKKKIEKHEAAPVFTEVPKVEVKPVEPKIERVELVAHKPEVKVQEKRSAPFIKNPPKKAYFHGTGGRKTSQARVWLSKGSGKYIINGKPMEKYACGRTLLLKQALEPFTLTNTANQYDIKASVHGGGICSQIGAVRQAVSAAISRENPELRIVLRRTGLLTRDPRVKERKKYGQKRARKRFQFSKR